MAASAENAPLATLRARIRALEPALPGAPRSNDTVSLGAPEVDETLPWGGLPRACVHEIVGGGTGQGAAAEGFCAALLARLVDGRGPALWCLARASLHGPGLGAFGLDPDRLIVARARRPADVLWAMEEGLRSGRLGAVLGEVHDIDLTAGRRLQLAARAGAATCLVLRPLAAAPAPGATRWRVAAAASIRQDGLPGLGAPRWQVDLVRCRGGSPRRWLLEWNHEARHLVVAAVLADRAPPAEVPQRRNAG